MNITIKGKNLDVGDSLRQHVTAGLEKMLGKFFGDAIESHVTFSRDAHRFRAHIDVHIGRGILLQSEESGTGDAYQTFDLAAEHLNARLRRYKQRLRDHHRSETDGFKAQQYVIAAPSGEEEAPPLDSAPAIIAEMPTEIPHLTVSEAVMRLDLSNNAALLFANRAHGQLNMVYRRSDGNIGWVDPTMNTKER
ncbi:MAG TPA: ribosome-associated translation inhibitor RaiA [Dongiaceae bacterium]|jgi:ribosomal subunit interface protein|nr:ribosome-associated translation inhibitor RaiA [Dongiaceae bacterium]